MASCTFNIFLRLKSMENQPVLTENLLVLLPHCSRHNLTNKNLHKIYTVGNSQNVPNAKSRVLKIWHRANEDTCIDVRRSFFQSSCDCSTSVTVPRTRVDSHDPDFSRFVPFVTQSRPWPTGQASFCCLSTAPTLTFTVLIVCTS